VSANDNKSPFMCILGGCTRRSRSKTKAGMCNTCYTRMVIGSSPKFPADPLLDYVESHGNNWANRTPPKRGGKVTLEFMDAFCIDVLGIHPWIVYGNLYFQECVS
jgi:hypothetical protein